MKTVHVVFNAHIDPIWLWPWQSGLDETFATCRSACDRLDAHPDLVFTRGEAWVYDVIERLDPALFVRIRAHIAAGRWEPVGGWWLQPDCNQPSGFAMQRQIALGKSYFESRFGTFPRIAYNVDSFGHAATLPGLMQAAGQDRYVMMRPQLQEMALPACLFRWRGYADGPEVTTFRIVDSYTSGNTLNERRIYNAVEQLPDGINDTMLFAGFGDHGGGPTERQIAWFREHENSFEGIRLVFSSPRRFFDAIWPQREILPLVTGELQFHAIGCYSVYRPIKTALRQAEHCLRQAEMFCAGEPSSAPADADIQINEAWKRVCFNHFHDTLGGTCLPSAYRYPLAQLGHAQDTGETLLQEGLRRKLTELPDAPLQRIVLYNASDLPFEGPIEFAPWLDWQAWQEDWHLIDEAGEVVPFQVIASEALAGSIVNLLFSLSIPAGGLRILRIQTEPGAREIAGGISPTADALAVNDSVCLSASALTFALGIELPLPSLLLIEDSSDTWTHVADRYGEQSCAEAEWGTAEIVDRGPLMASRICQGSIGNSGLTAEWRVYQEGFAELLLTVNWREEHKMLKLAQTLPGTPQHRTDGILGGWLSRPFDGREAPMRDGVLIETQLPGDDGERGVTFGIAAPDVYALDATPQRLRFTLLRSAIMAHHDPHNGIAPRRTFTDQGQHMFRFRYFANETIFTAEMEQRVTQMQRPPIIADLTRGMLHRPNDR